MGKYDVTRDQYAAVMGQPCPTPSPGGRIPQTGVSWFDAVHASAELSSWLLAHARDKLPHRGDSIGFVRLPTEDEWEFAARGGASVSETDFLARTWPMPDGIEHYAQAGTRMTGGRAQQVGQLKPNPLGLYDMLGNVQQLMLESFRLNRVGRLHGQAGGAVIRGGDYTSPLTSLHTAMRAELPPFDPRTSAPTRLSTVGFRLVLSAPSVGSLQETEGAKASFNEEVGREEAVPDDPPQLIAELRSALTTEALRRDLDRISAKLAAESRSRSDQEHAAMVAQLEAASVMANFVWSLEARAKSLERLKETLNGPTELAQLDRTINQVRGQESTSIEGYLRLVRRIALGPAGVDVAAQSQLLRQELTSRGQQQLFDLLTLTTKHALLVRSGQAIPRQQAIDEITAVPGATIAR